MGILKVWLITGTGGGMRLNLIKNLLNEGHRVAATTNDLKKLANIDGGHDQWLPILIRPNDKSSPGRAINQTITHFGQIDEVVSNPRFWKNMR